jgi:2',3'-cyclic-nucleotide 2'-phosphodiesterase (5'-nucleotidase family)
LARRATFIAQQRAQNQHLLVLDAGDALFSDRALTQASQGALIIEAMNMMGYDAMVLGEQDLRLGPAVLRERMKEAFFPFLSANVRARGEGHLFAQPYTLVDLGGRTWAIVGLTGLPPAEVAGLVVDDPVGAAREWIPEAARQAEVLIVLSHLGWSQNILLADMFPEVDLIIGGGAELARIQQATSAVTGSQLVQAEFPSAGHAGRMIGRWQVGFSNEGRLIVGEWQVVGLEPSYADDPAIVQLLTRYTDH